MSTDIVIIGGGLIGSSVAYHLAASGRGGEIVVLEPDPTYEFATTPGGSGGVRRLFSRPENVSLGSYGLDFYRDFKETMAVDGEPADIDERDPQHLRQDTRKAVNDLKRQGIQSYCLTLDPNANDYVRRIFGAGQYTIVDKVTRLPEKLPTLFATLTS